MPFRDSTDTLIVEEISLKSVSPRGIERENIATPPLSRSSTMPFSKGSGLRRNVKGMSRSMRELKLFLFITCRVIDIPHYWLPGMPNMARGVVISRKEKENGELVRFRSETVRSGKRPASSDESRPLANAVRTCFLILY